MDFWRTVMVLFRRWYITVPAFFLTLVMAGAAYSAVPVRYQSHGILVLTTPLSGGTEMTRSHSTTRPEYPDPLTNPLLNFDHSLALTASIVIQQLDSSESARSLGITPGGTTTYEVNNGTSNPELLESGPFIFIEGEGSSPEAAQDIAEKVAAAAVEILAQRQTEINAPASTHINIQVIVPPVAGKPLLSSPMRAAAAVGALASLSSLVAVYGFESLMTHRRRRKAEKQRAAEQGDPVSTTTRSVDDRFGGAATGAAARRSSNRDASGSPRRRHEHAPTVDHRVTSTSDQSRTASAVGVLESRPCDDDRARHDPSSGRR